MNSAQKEKVIRLMWTGGWDSSFRFLQLVLLENRKVQPYYVMDPERYSLGYELRAMQNIKKRLVEDRPELNEKILPTVFIEKASITIHEEISKARDELKKHAPFGDQYVWISSYALATGLKDLEMGAERISSERASYVDDRSVKIQEDGMWFYKIDDKHAGTPLHQLFRFYRFPIRELSKIDMLEISKREGFYHLMELTWFCHHPRRNGKPCGFCSPCTQAYKYGMKFRLSRAARFRYHVRWIYNREQFKVLFPRWYTFLNKAKTKGRKMLSK